MFGGDFLKAGKVLARGSRVAFALIRARKAELGRRMKRVGSERFLKSGDGFVVMLRLRLQITDKIETVRFGRKLGDVLESSNAFFDFARIFIYKSEVIPGVRILRKLAGSFLKRGAGRLEFLLTEKRHAEVEASHGELWIGGQRLLEFLLSISKFLLIHIRNAQRIEPQRVRRAGGVVLCGG